MSILRHPDLRIMGDKKNNNNNTQSFNKNNKQKV